MATSKKWAVIATFNTQGRCTNWRGWVQVMRRNFPGSWKHWDILERRNHHEIEQEILKYSPDHLLILLADGLKLNLSLIKTGKTKIIFYFADWTDRPEETVTQYTHCIDWMFLSNKDQIQTYKDLYRINNVNYLPMSCYKHSPIIPYNPDYSEKMIFVGNIIVGPNGDEIHGRRSKWWWDLKQTYGDSLVNINEPTYPKRNYIYDSLPAIYNSAKYSINMDAHRPQMDGYTSNRIWAILNFNGLCLTNYFKGMEDLGLRDSENCIVFNSPEEFRRKVSHYDDNPELREVIRQNGWELAVNMHTHQNRLEEILNVIGG